MKVIITNYFNHTLQIILNRPEVKNALNNQLISELSDIFSNLDSYPDIKLVIIEGSGDSFCAGADLNWLAEAINMDYKSNFEDSLKLVEMLELIKRCPVPLIAKIHGSAIGGGVGIALVSDIVVASDASVFGFSEVAIGVVPAAIISLLINRVGETVARDLLLTGRRINGLEAKNIGVVNYVVPFYGLNAKVNEVAEKILSNAPNAVRITKEMIIKSINHNTPYSNSDIADIIAKIRLSDEGRKGIASFLNR